MIIDENTEGGIFQVLLVLKDNVPLGLITELDTETKRYKKKFPTPHEGTYDRLVLCIEEHPSEFVRESPDMITKLCKPYGIEVLSKEEMDKLRVDMGVRV